MQLEEIKKYIIRDVPQRPLCETMMTVSINTAQCGDTIAEFQYLCEQPESIYFQGTCFLILNNVEIHMTKQNAGIKIYLRNGVSF
jgi:hypothetical protein